MKTLAQVKIEGGPLASAFGDEVLVNGASLNGFDVDLTRYTQKDATAFAELRKKSAKGQSTALCKSYAYRYIQFPEDETAGEPRVTICEGLGVPENAKDPQGLLHGTVNVSPDGQWLSVRFTYAPSSASAAVRFTPDTYQFEDVDYLGQNIKASNYPLTALLSSFYSAAAPKDTE